MTHCPSCGKVAEKPQRILERQGFIIETYNCQKCRHYFRITVNRAIAM